MSEPEKTTTTQPNPQHRPIMPGGGGPARMMPGEKAKDCNQGRQLKVCQTTDGMARSAAR